MPSSQASCRVLLDGRSVDTIEAYQVNEIAWGYSEIVALPCNVAILHNDKKTAVILHNCQKSFSQQFIRFNATA